jgi:hypothetical protein
MITELSEVSGMNADDKKVLQDLNAEIQAFNAAWSAFEAKRQHLADLDASDYTPADSEAAGRLRSDQVALLQRELAVRDRVNRWEPIRTRALGRAIEQTSAACDALVQKLVKQMVGLGFVSEVPVPGAGIVVPGILEQQIALHPKVAEAHEWVMALRFQRDDNSGWHSNRNAISQLQRKLEPVKARALATL